MREPDSIRFIGKQVLHVQGYGLLKLFAECDDRARPADLAITVGDKPIVTIRAFARRGTLDVGENTHPAVLNYFAGQYQSRPFLFLIGWREVWFLSAIDYQLSPIVRLNRSSTDDAGWYHLYIHEHADYFLLRYEAGACKLLYNGSLKWHVPLKWDDIYLHETADALVYSSEFIDGGNPWKLALEHGAIVREGR